MKLILASMLALLTLGLNGCTAPMLTDKDWKRAEREKGQQFIEYMLQTDTQFKHNSLLGNQDWELKMGQEYFEDCLTKIEGNPYKETLTQEDCEAERDAPLKYTDEYIAQKMAEYKASENERRARLQARLQSELLY